ncbi:PIN domain-containing protein [Candidatus Pacearchaeota archaeon]|nr:PIN domain-containing protein [Candidatus Pacearchaeota archaeon]
MKIILDTNFLVYCAKNKLDYKEEIGNLIKEGFELVVPEQVVDELVKIIKKTKEKNSWLLKARNPKFKKTTGRDKDAANLALQLLEFNKIKIIQTQGKNVDDAIINLANQDKKNIVCTLDREMRSALGRVILINRFKRLMLTK